MSPAPTATPIPAPKLGGYIQAREVAQEQLGLAALLNRARFSIDGALPQRFAYRFLVETEASAGARNPATDVDSLAPKYDVGIMADYAYGALAAVSLGAFNGEGANTIGNRDSIVTFVGRVTTRPMPQLALGASGTRDGADSLRWGVDASLQQSGGVVRAQYITRHVRRRARDKDDFGWYLFESFRVLPRVQRVARQEDFQRPLREISRRLRGLAYGTNFEIAPNRVRRLLEISRRVSGVKQKRAGAFIGQMQVQFRPAARRSTAASGSSPRPPGWTCR